MRVWGLWQVLSFIVCDVVSVNGLCIVLFSSCQVSPFSLFLDSSFTFSEACPRRSCICYINPDTFVKPVWVAQGHRDLMSFLH